MLDQVEKLFYTNLIAMSTQEASHTWLKGDQDPCQPNSDSRQWKSWLRALAASEVKRILLPWYAIFPVSDLLVWDWDDCIAPFDRCYKTWGDESFCFTALTLSSGLYFFSLIGATLTLSSVRVFFMSFCVPTLPIPVFWHLPHLLDFIFSPNAVATFQGQAWF